MKAIDWITPHKSSEKKIELKGRKTNKLSRV